MKRNYPYRAWSAGGGGGGGGTGDCCYQTITQAALVALKTGGTLEAGRTYLITDVTADWQVMVRAFSTTELTTEGNAIYQNTLYVEAWYDLMTNTLWKVYDPKYNNEVELQANVLAFSWNNPNWYNNKIVGGSQIFVNGGTAITFFVNNEINSGSTVDLTDGVITSFDLNSISEGSYLQISSSTLTSFTGNELSAQSSVQIQSSTITNCNGNQISAGTSVLLLSLTMAGVFSNNNLVDSNVNLITATVPNFHSNTMIQGTVVGNVTTCNDIIYNVISSRGTLNINTLNRLALVIRDNIISQNSTVTLSGVIVMNLFNGNSASGQSTITIAGGSCPSFSRNILEDATITATAMAIVTAVSDNNLLTGSSITLNNCTSTTVQYNVLSGTSQMICSTASVTNIQRNTLSANTLWDLTGSSGTSWLGNTFTGMSNMQFLGCNITNLKYNSISNYDGAFGGSSLTCPNFLFNTISSTGWTWGSVVFQQYIQKNVINGSTITTTNCTVFSLANNTINASSSITFLGALSPTQFDNNVIQSSQVAQDATSFLGAFTENALENSTVIDFSMAVVNVFQSNTIASSNLDFERFSSNLFLQNRISNTTLSNFGPSLGVAAYTQFRKNILNNATFKVYDNRTVGDFYNNEITNGTIEINSDITEIDDNYVLDNSSFSITGVTANSIRFNHISHGSILSLSTTAFTGTGVLEYLTIDNASQWTDSGTTFNSICNYLFVTNQSQLITENVFFKGDIYQIKVDSASTISIKNASIATYFRQVEVLSGSIMDIQSTASDIATFEYVSLNDNSFYYSMNDEITDVTQIRLIVGSVINTTGSTVGIIDSLILKNSTVAATGVTSASWQNFNLIDSLFTVADTSNGSHSEVNLVNAGLTTGTSPSFTNIRLENINATIDGTHTGKTAVYGVISNFEAGLDMSDASVFAGNVLTIPAGLDYVGIFTLNNTPAAANVKTLTPLGAAFTWDVRFYADSTLVWQSGAGNLKNNGGVNITTNVITDFVVYRDNPSAGNYYEQNSKVY